MSNFNQNYYQTGTPSGTPTGVKTGFYTTSGMVSRSAIHLGGMGAIVGGAAAAAQVIPQVRQNQMTSGQAARQVLKEAAGSGVATAAGAAVAGAVGMGGMVSLLALLSVATGVKYLWNSAFNEPAYAGGAPAEAPEEEPPAPAKAKAKKTAKK